MKQEMAGRAFCWGTARASQAEKARRLWGLKLVDAGPESVKEAKQERQGGSRLGSVWGDRR